MSNELSNLDDISLRIENENIVFDDLTVEDKDFVFKLVPKDKKYNMPLYWPVEDKNAKNVVFNAVDCVIYDKSDDTETEIEDFYIYFRERFNKNASNALNILKLLSALDDPDKVIKGGVYLRGKLVTSQNREFFQKKLFQRLINRYFTIEDGDMIFDYLPRDLGSGYPLLWPKYNNKHEDISYTAINATVIDKNSPKDIVENVNFNIYPTEIFDLSDPETVKKIKILTDVLNENKIVTGLYYKGELIPKTLTSKYKESFARTLIRKNFTLEDRDYILDNATRDPKNNMPLFWPQFSKNGRQAIVSVVNYNDRGKFVNFDIFEDETLDIDKPADKKKYKIIRDITNNQDKQNAGLYYRGNLLFGSVATKYEPRRLKALETSLGYAIFTNKEKEKMNKVYTVDDAQKIIDHVQVINYEKEPNSMMPLFIEPLKVQGIILAVLESDLSDVFTAKKHEKVEDEFVNDIVEAFNKTDNRRNLYYKGHLIPGKYTPKKTVSLLEKIKKEFNLSFDINEEKIIEFCEKRDLMYNKINEEFKFTFDKKSKMPKYWPTEDSNGRKVLLSVVDSNIHFHMGRVTVKASNNINFNVYVGETFGLVGESGSGKTTISRAILGLNKLTKGAIYFHGELISSGLKGSKLKEVKSKIQMIFQDPAASLNDRANIDYIVSEGLESFNLYTNQADRLQKVEAMMERVGLLPEHLSRFPHEFSGGQRQRIGIARALIINPELVLADEPISALDVSIRAQVLNLLKELQTEQKLTYIFVAHDLSIIRYISDRVAVMHQGYIVELGEAEDIYKNPVHPYTRSLLTAIPQPDPNSEFDRVRVPYDKGNINYARNKWIEVSPNHYVLGNNKLVKKWTKK